MEAREVGGRPRVLLVGKGPPDRGGIAAYLRFILGSRLATRWQLTFLNVAHDAERQGGRLSFGNLRRTVGDGRAVWRRAAVSDVVHIHSALAPGVTLARAGALATVAKARGAHVVVHAHGGKVQSWLGKPGRRAIARLALMRVDRVVAVSQAGRSALAEVVGDRVLLIDNGVDAAAYSTVRNSWHPDRPLSVLYVGLLTPRKGLLDLFDASDLLRKWGVPHELRLVGGEPDEGAAAERLVRMAAATRSVDLVGAVAPEDMPAVYAAADIFCLPSWWEAMPLSLLEAMAAGLPVVASAVGDVARVIEDEVSGMLVPPRDPTRLAAALVCLLLDPQMRERLGRAARDRVEGHFSAERTVAALDGVYSSLCEEHR